MKRSCICGTAKAAVLMALSDETPLTVADMLNYGGKLSSANLFATVKQLLAMRLIYVTGDKLPSSYLLTPLGELVVDALYVLGHLILAESYNTDPGVGRELHRALNHQRQLIERISKGLP